MPARFRPDFRPANTVKFRTQTQQIVHQMNDPVPNPVPRKVRRTLERQKRKENR